MRIYEYDGSVEGYHCALARAADDPDPAATPALAGASGDDLFVQRTPVAADPARARAFRDGLRALAPDAPGRLLDGYMADGDPAEGAFTAYVRLIRARGGDVDGWLTQPAVARVLAVSRRVRKECHAFKGLLRFRQVRGGLLWAPYRPVANITAALVPHFIQRNRNDAWLIHDVHRGLGALWNRQRLAWLEGDELPAGLTCDPDEQAIAALWRRFHAAVAIPERINPDLQRRNMPARYWEFLTETPGASEIRHRMSTPPAPPAAPP